MPNKPEGIPAGYYTYYPGTIRPAIVSGTYRYLPDGYCENCQYGHVLSRDERRVTVVCPQGNCFKREAEGVMG